MNSPLFRAASTLMLACMLALAACTEEKTTATPNAGTTAAAVPKKYSKVEDLPESERQELDAFGQKLHADLRAKNIPEVKAAFHVPGMVAMAMEGVKASGTNFENFRSGMEKGLGEGIDFVIKTWSENEAKYKGLVIHNGDIKLRFRVSSMESGVVFLDLSVKRRADGRLGVVDFYNHAAGGSMSDQARQNALPIFMELDKGFLDRIFDKPSEFVRKDILIIGEMTEAMQKKEFQSTIDGYQKLSPESQRRILPTLLHLAALQQKQDNEAYKAALKEAAKTQDAANFQFMLIDLHFLEGNYDKAIECVDRIMATLEKDAALLAIKSALLLNKGAMDDAKAVVKEAFALEPDSAFVHMKCLDVYLAAKDHATVAASLRFLEANSPYRFKGVLTNDPVWADFVKSPESEPWR